MGQTLSEPVVDKHSANGKDDRTIFGVSSMQGWRISMEDAHACVLDLIPREDYGRKPKNADGEIAPTPPDARISFFGVYDGHGGDKVAMYAGEHLHEIIAQQQAFGSSDMEKALKDGFLATDRAILNDPRYEDEVSGCTACVGLLSKSKIYVGNAGDSRGVLGIKGRAKPMSFDHKPQNDAERARITAAGGFVDFGRVNGNLALSRAIGDFEFKKTAELPPEQQIVTAFPDVTEHDITDDDEFLVIACDGIWDCQSSQAVVEFVRRGIVARQELAAICENLMDNCLARTSDTGGVGCDNMTVIIIGLLKGKTKDEWYQEIADRVANGDGPCAPPEFAEHRGPGMSHGYDDPQADYEMPMDLDHRPQSYGRLQQQRIIVLGDVSNHAANAAATAGEDHVEEDMYDREDEDQDLEVQVGRSTPSGSEDEGDAAAEERSRREGTPAPQSQSQTLSSRRMAESPGSGTAPNGERDTPAKSSTPAATSSSTTSTAATGADSAASSAVPEAGSAASTSVQA